MLSRRNVSILSILALTSVVLFQFQNCAPAKPASAAAEDGGGGDTRIVDEYNKAAIQFVAPEIQVREDIPSADISGLCSREHTGAHLQWALWSTNGQIVARGEGSCRGGGFNVKVEGLSDVVCGTQYQLAVEGDWGGSASAAFVQRCQPLASEAVVDDSGSVPYGTECALEYVPSGESQSPCKQVCYRLNLLVSEMPVEAARCSGMAARLAGP